MVRTPLRRAALALGLAAVLGLPFPLHPAGANPPEVLAAADFNGDAVGAAARPFGPPTVTENLWEAGDTTGGISAVEDSTAGKRYRLSDVGTSGGVRAVRLPLSGTVSSGTVVIRAVATAGQEDAEGGYLNGGEPDPEEWLCGLGFGGDGNFSVHGAATTTAYQAGTRYRFRITLYLDGTPTADYRIYDAATNELLLESTGHSLPSGAGLSELTFRTGTADDGSFTVDDIGATR